MLLYIIFIVIIYLTDTYICKKTISHILLTYKNNFLTNKILNCFGTKILVIVYKSLVRFKDECNNITYYLNKKVHFTTLNKVGGSHYPLIYFSVPLPP